MSSDIIRIADHLYGIRTYFYPNQTDGPYIVSFLALGRIAVLFDSGLRSTADDVLQLLARLGRAPDNLRLILNSHAHHDHIGANGSLKEATGCLVVAEASGVPWIEDHQRQHREFFLAFPDAWQPTEEDTRLFFEWLGPETSVEVHTNGAFTLSLGDGVLLDVFLTPGHISSCLSMLDRATGLLLCGDSFQDQGFFGNLPQYDDVASYGSSLKAYAGHMPRGILTAHTPPFEPASAAEAVARAEDLRREVGDMVHRLLRDRGKPTHLREVTSSICEGLGRTYNIQALCTIDAHLRDLEQRDLARRAEANLNVWIG